MTRRLTLALFLLTPLLLTPFACGGDGDGTDPGPDTEDFAATLNAGNVVADVVSNATGTAELSYDGIVLDYAIDVADMDNITAAHIHGPATTEVDANIILTLYAPDNPAGEVNGRLVSGSVGTGSSLLTPGITLDSVLVLMRTDQAYVLVHSTEYPNGEIRGQVDPQ